ncbi:MAG: hypothetical protein CMP58_03645 [Flavobacteriales bacterium]|nr:hypothetical protein [Flavobacteriales bacterium]
MQLHDLDVVGEQVAHRFELPVKGGAQAHDVEDPLVHRVLQVEVIGRREGPHVGAIRHARSAPKNDEILGKV